MAVDRDVAAFDRRAAGYERGWLGRLHQEIAERTVAVALSSCPAPRRILDVGCGSGYALRSLAARCADAVEIAGVDPAPAMVALARGSTADPRIVIADGYAERLPYPDAAFDLVVSTTSFDHWADQAAGVGECARVLAPGGRLVIADLFSPWLIPTLAGRRSRKARTKRRAGRLLSAAGLRIVGWHDLYPLIKAVIATA
jgi:ubiquinone/menaquinone biosynthesis C-methylase UbiE